MVQFILLPVIRIKHSIFALLVGNLLYFGSIGYYFVVSFYGYNSLPFISANFGNYSSFSSSANNNNKNNPARTLQLVVVAGILPILALGWLVTLLFRINVADSMVDIYFN